MGLPDMVTDALGKGFSSDTKAGNPLLNIAMQMISDPNNGGLQGLVNLFRENGLDRQVASWVNTGMNLPVSSDQIMNVFGGDQLGKIANQLGISKNEAAGGLADMLPEIIDRLTPDGQMPEGDLLTQGLNMLTGRLFS